MIESGSHVSRARGGGAVVDCPLCQSDSRNQLDMTLYPQLYRNTRLDTQLVCLIAPDSTYHRDRVVVQLIYLDNSIRLDRRQLALRRKSIYNSIPDHSLYSHLLIRLHSLVDMCQLGMVAVAGPVYSIGPLDIDNNHQQSWHRVSQVRLYGHHWWFPPDISISSVCLQDNSNQLDSYNLRRIDR